MLANQAGRPSSSSNTREERAPREWYNEAVRWYLQGHQGCPSCQERHCVFRSDWGTRVEYHCTTCDFSVCHDSASGLYLASAGDAGAAPGTGLLFLE